MSFNITENSNDIFKDIYGSNFTIDNKSSETITEPEIIFQDEKKIKVINNIENNKNNENEEEDLNKLNDVTASKYEIIKKICNLGEDKSNAKFISELTNGYIIISTYERFLNIYNNKYKIILKIKFPFFVNSFHEIKNNDNNKLELICFTSFSIYKISFDSLINKVNIEKCIISDSINKLDDKNKSDENNKIKDKENKKIEKNNKKDEKQNENKKEKNDKKDKDNKNKIIDNEQNIQKKLFFNYHFILKLKNNQEILCTNNGVYKGENLINKKEDNSNIIIKEQYIEAVTLNDNLICLKSNKQLTKGEDSLIIYNIKKNNIIKKIEGYSFTVSVYRLNLISLNKNKKILICSCTKYSSDQKNGILIINFDLNNDEVIDTNIFFEETESFNINCICCLNLNHKNDNNEEKKINKIYLLVGGVDDEYNQGLIKLCQIDLSQKKANIEVLQDLEFEENFEGTLSSIYQLKNGKIIVSSGSGNILFTAPNLDGYNEDILNNDE